MKETKFKPSLLQSIPEDWSDGTFGDFLTTFSSGATPYRGIPSNFVGKIPWISSGELNYNRITDTNEHISQEAQRNTHLTLHKTGTFLMAITGLEAAGTRGRCAFIGTPATTNQSCLAINSTDKMTVEYLFWFYRYWSDFLAFNYSQGSKQQSFTAKIAKKLPIYAPKELQEQKAIAEALTDIDELIKGLDEWIAQKKAILEGTMQELLSGKRRLPGFSEPWKDMIISDVCERYDNLRIPVSANLREKGNIPYYGANGIQDFVSGYTHKGEFVLIAEDGANSIVNYPIRYVCGKIWVNNHAHVLQGKAGRLDTLFLSFILRTIDFASAIVGGSRNKLNATTLMTLSFKAPDSRKEQLSIASLLHDMDAEVEALKNKREKYVAIRQGMIQQLLTGKIRLI